MKNNYCSPVVSEPFRILMKIYVCAPDWLIWNTSETHPGSSCYLLLNRNLPRLISNEVVEILSWSLSHALPGTVGRRMGTKMDILTYIVNVMFVLFCPLLEDDEGGEMMNRLPVLSHKTKNKRTNNITFMICIIFISLWFPKFAFTHHTRFRPSECPCFAIFYISWLRSSSADALYILLLACWAQRKEQPKNKPTF